MCIHMYRLQFVKADRGLTAPDSSWKRMALWLEFDLIRTIFFSPVPCTSMSSEYMVKNGGWRTDPFPRRSIELAFSALREEDEEDSWARGWLFPITDTDDQTWTQHWITVELATRGECKRRSHSTWYIDTSTGAGEAAAPVYVCYATLN